MCFGEDVGALREALRPVCQVPNPDVMEVRKLADDISAPALGERATHTGVAGALDQSEIDSVIDPPCLENLLDHMVCHLLRRKLTDLELRYNE
jgi:hypothetical protein